MWGYVPPMYLKDVQEMSVYLNKMRRFYCRFHLQFNKFVYKQTQTRAIYYFP